MVTMVGCFEGRRALDLACYMLLGPEHRVRKAQAYFQSAKPKTLMDGRFKRINACLSGPNTDTSSLKRAMRKSHHLE
jgi:hypothetical protein